MNLFDPALEKGVEELLAGFNACAQQAQVVPQVASALMGLVGHANKFFVEARQRQFDAILAGQSPKVQMARMIKPHTHVSTFKWDLIQSGQGAPLVNRPAWVNHRAFCMYLRWLQHQQAPHPLSMGPNEMPLIPARIRQGYSIIGYPRRKSTVNDGGGQVHLEYSIPALSFSPVTIESGFEDLPPIMSSFTGVQFHVNFAWFYDQHFERAYNFMVGEEWAEVPFPVIHPKEPDKRGYEDVTIRLKDFIMVYDDPEGYVAGHSFVDGIITFRPESWQESGYSLTLSAPLALVMGNNTSGSFTWDRLPRPLQIVINQLTLMKVGDREQYGLFEGDHLQVELDLINPCEYVVRNPVVMEAPPTGRR